MSVSWPEVPDEVAAADLVDAMGRIHRHRCHLLDLVTPTPGRRLFGPCVTISYFPTCEAVLDPRRYGFGRLLTEAAGGQPEGKVVVLASNGHTDISLGGGTKLARAEQVGLGGVLADGRLRDFDELADYSMTVYCRGETTRWGGDVVTPFQANVPVVVGGVGIHPGDFIYADSSGALTIPARDIEAVIEGALAVVAEDAAYLEALERRADHQGGPVESGHDPR
jgi:regulator of RNase E activity RraA